MAIILRNLQFNYESSFRLLVDDFITLLDYVDPVDANLHVHSLRSYELLLRACTEFESLAKETLVASGSTRPMSKMTLSDYRDLEQHLQLERIEIGLLMWSTQPAYVAPFTGWSNPSSPVTWYKDYNLVKHNRSLEFHRASLSNVRASIAAVFALLVSTRIPNLTGVSQATTGRGGFNETVIKAYPYSRFSVRVPI